MKYPRNLTIRIILPSDYVMNDQKLLDETDIVNSIISLPVLGLRQNVDTNIKENIWSFHFDLIEQTTIEKIR